MIWGLIQTLSLFGLCGLFLMIGWAIGYKEGKEYQQLKIERMRRAINASREG